LNPRLETDIIVAFPQNSEVFVQEFSWSEFLTKRRQENTRVYSPTRSVGENIHFIRAKDTTGQMACYFVRVPETLLPFFQQALRRNKITSLEDYGEIVASNYGNEPSSQTKQILHEKYGIEL
jgi:hypothetical protein